MINLTLDNDIYVGRMKRLGFDLFQITVIYVGDDPTFSFNNYVDTCTVTYYYDEECPVSDISIQARQVVVKFYSSQYQESFEARYYLHLINNEGAEWEVFQAYFPNIEAQVQELVEGLSTDPETGQYIFESDLSAYETVVDKIEALNNKINVMYEILMTLGMGSVNFALNAQDLMGEVRLKLERIDRIVMSSLVASVTGLVADVAGSTLASMSVIDVIEGSTDDMSTKLNQIISFLVGSVVQ